jgi:hypothetical protein
LRELNKTLGRSRDRQFRFKPITSVERIKDIEEKNKICDPIPTDLYKKSFILRPRETQKEIGPPCFRNNSQTVLDLI